MMRLSAILSLAFVGAASALSQQETDAAAVERALQDLDALNAFQFNFGGVNVNAEIARTSCPNEWTPTVQCVVTGCSNFRQVCDSDFEIESDNVGTLPPNETLAPGSANITDRIPQCDEIEELFCDNFATVNENGQCCLFDCAQQIRDLVVCVVRETAGVDRSECDVPTCPSPAPVDSDTNGDAATDSSATSFAAKLAFGAAMAAVAFLV